MVKITFIEPDETQKHVEAEPGFSLMEAATHNGVQGIAAECGGQCSCATCHVYVDDAWRTRAGETDDMEDAILDAVEAPRTEASRLSCQITATDALDGIVLHVPSPD